MIEHIEPVSIPWLGGERLLHRLSYRVYAANAVAMREARVLLEKPKRPWLLRELASDAKVSLGLAVKCKQTLIEQAYMFDVGGVFTVRDPQSREKDEEAQKKAERDAKYAARKARAGKKR